MAAKKKLNEFDARPGEIVVMASPPPNSRVVFVVDDVLGYGAAQRAHVLAAGHRFILPARLFARADSTGSQLVKMGQLSIIDGRGEIAPIENFSDSARRAELRDGHRPVPSRQSRIEHWQDTLVDRSLCEAVVDVLMAAGLSDDIRDPEVGKIVRDLVACYDQAFLRSDGSASRRVWLDRAQELIAIHRARTAGLVDTKEVN